MREDEREKMERIRECNLEKRMRRELDREREQIVEEMSTRGRGHNVRKKKNTKREILGE